MRTDFLPMLRAEIGLLSRRPGTWVIFGIWATVTAVFAYVLPYVAADSGGDFFDGMDVLLPAALAGTVADGVPFYGGALSLILGVLAIGSEFGWGTWKTLFTQRPGRSEVFGAKLAALGVMLIPFTLVIYVIGAIASTIIAMAEGEAISFPTARALIESAAASWLILAVWAAAGVALAVVTRGTSLAIGIGILWALAFEGLLSAFARSISWLEGTVDFLLRANGYSLVRMVSGSRESSADGPGAFSGPYVGGTQALVVLALYLIVFLGGSLVLIRRRDVA